MASSLGGNPVSMIYIGPDAGSRDKKLPAVLVAANLEGTQPLAIGSGPVPGAIHPGKTGVPARTRDGIILPLGNPDAAANYFSRPLAQDSRNRRPHNDDMDDREDEDGGR